MGKRGERALSEDGGITEEYRRFWLDTADCVLNFLLGNQGGSDTAGRICRWSEEEGTIAFPENLEEYGLERGSALGTAEGVLQDAERKTAPLRGLSEGFAQDAEGCPYTPAKKAEAVYEGICREIRREVRQYYGVDLSGLAELCGMTYEREEAEASLAFFPRMNNPPGGDGQSGAPAGIVLGAGSRIPFERARLREIRKFLAGAAAGESLVFTEENGRYVCRGYASLASPPPLSVTLQGRRGGLFSVKGAPWFRLAGERILVPGEPYRPVWRKLCRELNLPEADYEGLFRALSRQSKGAGVVLADLSESVTGRWYACLAECGRAWKLEDVSVVNLSGDGEERIRALSRIDGALVVDTSTGRLAYTGAVLDALAITDGLRDRGARANSILSHVANLAILGGVSRPIGAAVYSEDGMVTPVLGSAYAGSAEERRKSSRHPAVGALAPPDVCQNARRMERAPAAAAAGYREEPASLTKC